MGTRFDLIMVVENLTKGVRVWDKLVKELENLDKILNRFSDESEISKINTAAYQQPVQVSAELWKIITDCKKYHELTYGLFDVTLHNFELVEFNSEAQTIFFKEDDMSLDFGGYARGYALEKLKKIIAEAKIYQAFINFGNSSICCIGTHPLGDNWSVGIVNPYNTEQTLGELQLKNMCLSVSGNTPHNRKHIVQPLTRKYLDSKRIMCVSAGNAAIAEVLSTTLILATEKEKSKIKKRFKDIASYVENEYHAS